MELVDDEERPKQTHKDGGKEVAEANSITRKDPSDAGAAADDADAAAEFLRAFKAVDRDVKFDTEFAAKYIREHDFKGLEDYVLDVLGKIQRHHLYQHPGIFFSIHQSEIAFLIKEEKYIEAEKVFNDKVKPLVSESVDILYRPFNLENQVKALQNCVYKRVKPKMRDKEEIGSLIVDYLHLYFPSCLIDAPEREGSVYDFFSTINDESGDKRFCCLACQWNVPLGVNQGKLVMHFKGDAHGKHCRNCYGVSRWMLGYIDYLQTKVVQSKTTLVVKPKKKKTPCSSDLIVTMITKCGDISKALGLALVDIGNDDELLGTTTLIKGKEIYFKQRKLIYELIGMFLAMDKHNPMDASSVFLEIKSLSDLVDDLSAIQEPRFSSGGFFVCHANGC